MINDLALNNQRHEIPEWPQTNQPRNKKLALRDTCSNGHKFTPENTYKRKDGGRKCRACRNIQQAERNANMTTAQRAKVTQSKAKYRAKLKGLPIPDLEELVKRDPLQYLMATGQVGELEEKLNLAIEESHEKDGTLPPCYKNPGPYQDYDERNPPSPVQAAILCGDCPFRIANACGAYASVLRPTNGVWNGTRWRESSKVGVGEPVVRP